MDASKGFVTGAMIRAMGPITTALLVVAGSYPCSSDTVENYLGSRYINAHVPCGSKNYIKLIGTGKEDPEGWNSGWRSLPGSATGTRIGTIVEEKYYMDGVKKHYKWEVCRDKAYGFSFTPAEYVHRFLVKFWSCGGGSCQYLGSSTTGWSKGVKPR